MRLEERLDYDYDECFCILLQMFCIPQRNLVFTLKTFEFFANECKVSWGKMQNICERMQKYINIYNISYFLSITMSLKCLCRGLIVKKN